MLEIAKHSITAIPEDEWQDVAKRIGVNPDQLKKDYEAVISDPRNLREMSVNIGQQVKSDDCVSTPFEFSFFKVLGIKGEVKFCGTNTSNWTATVDVCLTLLGNQVACHKFELDSTHLEYCYNIDVRLAKAKVCFGVNTRDLCLYTRGKACAWALGWHCQDFDQRIICLPH
jgi:hypothetical protein